MSADSEVIDDGDNGEEGPRKRPPGSRLNLNQEIEEFTERTTRRLFPKYGSRYRELIAKDWKETQQLFEGKATSTKKLYGSKFRDAVYSAINDREADPKRRAELLETMKELLRTDRAILDEVNDRYQQKVSTNAKGLVFVEHYMRIIEIANKWLVGDSDDLRALALMLVTGRRFYEVLVAGDFGRTVIETPRGTISPKYRMDFSGQLKTREAEGSKFDTLYNIPTLAPVVSIIKAVNMLRSSPMGKEVAVRGEEFANSNYNPRLNKVLRASAIGELWPKGDRLTVKQLRTLYAEVCFKHHAPSTTHKDAYFAEILGHRDGDMSTALSYVRYYLDKKDGEAARIELERLIKAKEEADAAYWAQRQADEEASGDGASQGGE